MPIDASRVRASGSSRFSPGGTPPPLQPIRSCVRCMSGLRRPLSAAAPAVSVDRAEVLVGLAEIVLVVVVARDLEPVLHARAVPDRPAGRLRLSVRALDRREGAVLVERAADVRPRLRPELDDVVGLVDGVEEREDVAIAAAVEA